MYGSRRAIRTRRDPQGLGRYRGCTDEAILAAVQRRFRTLVAGSPVVPVMYPPMDRRGRRQDYGS